jgi:hypothetical protein
MRQPGKKDMQCMQAGSVTKNQRAGIDIDGWPYTTSCLAWLEESDTAGVICTGCDGRSIPIAVLDHTVWKELLSCELMAFTVAVI